MVKLIRGSLVLLLVMTSGCAKMLDENKYTSFDYNPYKYWEAKATKRVTLPADMASNLKYQPLYPIPTEQKLKGEINLKKIPPTLEGKITDYS